MRRAALLLLGGFVLLIGWLAVPPTALAACPVPEVPGAGCVVPPEPSASPSPSPSPSTSASPSPSQAPSPSASASSSPAPSAVQPSAAPLVTAGVVPVVVPSEPEVLLPPVLSTPAVPQPAAVAVSQSTSAPVASLAGVVASSFALVAFGLLVIPLLLAFLASLSTGGTVNNQRNRLWAGLGVLGAAAAVGGIGWYRLSGEPLLNRQIPFLASAGIVVVLLSVLGGSLIIAEQLRNDQRRMTDLEDAVRSLTEALAPIIEQPPRISSQPVEVVEVVSQPSARGRSRRAAADRS